jgi:3-oxoadipate enol-lactonase
MTLSHDLTGTGPTVVLLHSSIADRRMWQPQVPVLLDAGYQVLSCDFRGYGETPMAQTYSDAEDVRDLLDELAVPAAVVVGSSFGGRVAQEIAVRWPDRVSGLVLLCPGMTAARPSPELMDFAEREDSLLAIGDIDGAADLNVATWLGPEADDHTRTAVRSMQRHAFEVQVAFGPEAGPSSTPVDVSTIDAPTLVVSGAHDLQDFRAIAAFLASKIPGARHVELSWAGHLPSLERPGDVNELLVDFLSADSRERHL